MSTFSRIGIVIKQEDERLEEPASQLLHYLSARQVKVYLDETLTSIGIEKSETMPRRELAKNCDLIIVVGGDGTLLDSARSIADFQVPLVGVNMGRLGFLTDISPHEIREQLDLILAGNYYDERRAMMFGRIVREGTIVTTSHALNDIVIHVGNAVRMIEFETRIDGQLVHTQRADGMVVSTPTGSTAYALSGGGPIVHPELDAVLLVPICPHTLSSRPIIVSGNSEIEITLTPQNHTQARVAFDGQVNVDLEPEDTIIIQKKPHALHLIHPPQYDYYRILREKLHWSELP